LPLILNHQYSKVVRHQTPRHGEAGWTNPKVIAILAVVFLCGSVVGATLMRNYLHARLVPPTGKEIVLRGQRVDFNTLKQSLNLTSVQEQTVVQVLDDFAKYYQNIEEQREDIAESGKRRILAVLSPEQKERFYRLFKEKPSDRP
jgi:hypothetical protein